MLSCADRCFIVHNCDITNLPLLDAKEGSAALPPHGRPPAPHPVSYSYEIHRFKSSQPIGNQAQEVTK